SSGWARKRAPPCARTGTAAGRGRWSTSRTKPRRRADRRSRPAAPDNAKVSHRKENTVSTELYAVPPSQHTLNQMAAANPPDLDCEIRFIDLRKGDQKTPQYAALNPNMRMPTLKEGDYVLWESSAIAQYLASKKPGSGLLPQDERRRLDVTRWQFWEHAHWDPACAVFAFEYVAKPIVVGINEPEMAAIAKGTEAFHRIAQVLDGHLKNKRFVTGDTLTLADFGIGSAMILAERAHYPIEPYGEIKRWYATLRALPA